MADDEPVKMSLTNLRNGKTLEAQFNPPEIGAKVSVVYNDLAILGLSHRPQQFSYVENIEVTPELYFDRLTRDGGGGGSLGYDRARKLLWAWTLPSAADVIADGDPPDILFVWPKLYSLVCRIRTLDERHMRMAKDGSSTLMTIRPVLHHFSEFRILSEDVEADGLERQ